MTDIKSGLPHWYVHLIILIFSTGLMCIISSFKCIPCVHTKPLTHLTWAHNTSFGFFFQLFWANDSIIFYSFVLGGWWAQYPGLIGYVLCFFDFEQRRVADTCCYYVDWVLVIQLRRKTYKRVGRVGEEMGAWFWETLSILNSYSIFYFS